MPRPNSKSRIRRTLARAIERTLAASGITVVADPETLFPAQGWWRTSGEDCYAWDGWIVAPTEGGSQVTFAVGSYDTMTECVRGMQFTRTVGTFEFHATCA